MVGPRKKEQTDPLSFNSLMCSAPAVKMKADERRVMIAYQKPFMCRRFLIVPVLTAVCWFISQKGCELAPDVSPARTFAGVATSTSQPVTVSAEKGEPAPPRAPYAKSLSSEAKNLSLRHAGELLRKAATALDKNERVAIRLILQAIAILKHELMQGIDEPDYDYVSRQPASSPNHLLLWKARTTVPSVPGPPLWRFETPAETHGEPHRNKLRRLFSGRSQIADE